MQAQTPNNLYPWQFDDNTICYSFNFSGSKTQLKKLLNERNIGKNVNIEQSIMITFFKSKSCLSRSDRHTLLIDSSITYRLDDELKAEDFINNNEDRLKVGGYSTKDYVIKNLYTASFKSSKNGKSIINAIDETIGNNSYYRY